MAKSCVWSFILCLFMIVSGGCTSVPQGTAGRVVVQDDQSVIDVAFSSRDRALLHEYYRSLKPHTYKPLPPGLAKKGKIPPGHQKQLVRHGHLPPGLQYQPLPGHLEHRLSPLPDGYSRIMIDGTFILFHQNTRVIFDVVPAS